MADRLDDLLQPGERVLYRAPRNRLPVEWRLYVVAIPTMFMFYVAKVAFGPLPLWPDAGFVTGVLIASAIAIPLLAGPVCIGWLYDRAVETLVTDRRLLHRTGLRKAEVIEVPLADIEKVEFKLSYSVALKLSFSSGLLRISSAEDGMLHLPDLARAQPLARALAAAANLPRPVLVGPLEHVHFYAFLLCGLPAAIFCAGGVVSIPWEQFGLSEWDLLLRFLLIWPALFVPVFAGGFLGDLLFMAIVRYRASAAEMRAWLHMEPLEPGKLNTARWLNRPLVAWATFLYDQPMHEPMRAG